MTSLRVPPRGPASRVFPPGLGERAELIELDSDVLRGNPLGDPSRRQVAVLRPPSGRTEGAPLLVLLSGYGGAGSTELNRTGPFEENLFQLFDRLQRTGACGEATVLSPDCLTALGGSQYVNSSATGRYDDYVIRELIPWARDRYRTGPIGVLGQSSGGFGALHLAFEHPGTFGAVGVSAGDMGFEYCFLADLARACREYQRHGGPERFLAKLFEDPSLLKGPTSPAGAALLIAGVSACFSPIDGDPGAFELPCVWETAELLPDVWARWKRFDPIDRVGRPEGAAALGRAGLLAITGSTGDEWVLDQSARWFVAAARRQGLSLVHEEFPGGHFERSPRFTTLFTRLVSALRA